MKLEHIFYKLGRFGIGFVFVYFGATSIIAPDAFSRLVPDFISSIIDPNLVVVIHGLFETIFGFFLAFGLFGRLPIIVLTILIIPTILSVSGFTRIRDIGILSGLLLLISDKK